MTAIARELDYPDKGAQSRLDDLKTFVDEVESRLNLLSTEATLNAVLTELNQKLEAGQEVALSPATLATLENITVTVTNPTANPETGLAKDTTLVQVRDRVGDITVPAVGTTNARLEELRLLLSSQAKRFEGGKTAVTATVTEPGDTAIYTPAPGNRISLSWISAINDPDESTSPLIRIKLGATEIYRAYAVAHWEIFEGAPGEALVVNLSDLSSVAVTAHLKELT